MQVKGESTNWVVVGLGLMVLLALIAAFSVKEATAGSPCASHMELCQAMD